jgi:nitrile hydratase
MRETKITWPPFTRLVHEDLGLPCSTIIFQFARRQWMSGPSQPTSAHLPGVVSALGEQPIFKPGDQVRILSRSPVGHYRVPTYLRGKIGLVEEIIEPTGLDNEEEGFGRNAGSKRHYYRVAIPMTEIWPGYVGSPRDGLRIEVFETWLERGER